MNAQQTAVLVLGQFASALIHTVALAGVMTGQDTGNRF
jgi:hypothetical protein